MPSKPFHVYILLCSDGTYYTGHTDNLEARLVDHETGRYEGYTKSRRPRGGPDASVYGCKVITREKHFREFLWFLFCRRYENFIAASVQIFSGPYRVQ